MDDKIRKVLERPFATADIRRREGPGGKQFDYVPIQLYIDRLAEAFNGAWSFEVTRREQVDDQLLVEGRLTAGGVIKTGLGGATITRRRDDGRVVDLANDYKRAEADALKRCCRLLGIGGHLYAADGDDDAEPAIPVAVPARTGRAPSPTTLKAAPAPSAPSQQRAPQERTRLTAKQLAAILAIAKGRGYDEKKFRSQIVERFGAQPEYLTRTQASALISSLNGNGHDRVAGEEG